MVQEYFRLVADCGAGLRCSPVIVLIAETAWRPLVVGLRHAVHLFRHVSAVARNPGGMDGLRNYLSATSRFTFRTQTLNS